MANGSALDLATLSGGMPGLTPAWGKVLAEAAAVCLEHNQHVPGVQRGHRGLITGASLLVWELVDEQQRRSHADIQEATELGACGVAIVSINAHLGQTVVERSRKGRGFDYWLGEAGNETALMFGTVRLEVSGILQGNDSDVNARLKQKAKQISISNNLAPGLVAVVEFGRPLACLEMP